MSDFDQRNQNVDAQYNAGRDQIIQNIVLVGRFLDFTRVEGLIPKPQNLSNFESVSAAFETTFSQRLGDDLAQATAFAGEVLKEILKPQWISTQPYASLPFRDILRKCPEAVYNKFSQFGYWKSFCIPYRDGNNAYEIIFLHSLERLWKKHFRSGRLFGIGPIWTSSGWISPDFYEKLSDDHIKPLDEELVTNTEFRVLMVGLVIDIIRISSIATDDVKFWNELVDLLL